MTLMRLSATCLLAISLALGGCATEISPRSIPRLNGAEPQVIEAKFSGAKEPQVLYGRAKNSLSGLVLGGLVGGLIEGGIRAANDSALRGKLTDAAGPTQCVDAVKQSFMEVVAANVDSPKARIFVSSETSSSQSTGTTFVLDVRSCGFQLIDAEHSTLAAFVDVDLALKQAGKSDALWHDRETILGDLRPTATELKEHPEQFVADLSSVLRHAGAEVAYKLMYR